MLTSTSSRRVKIVFRKVWKMYKMDLVDKTFLKEASGIGGRDLLYRIIKPLDRGITPNDPDINWIDEMELVIH